MTTAAEPCAAVVLPTAALADRERQVSCYDTLLKRLQGEFCKPASGYCLPVYATAISKAKEHSKFDIKNLRFCLLRPERDSLIGR